MATVVRSIPSELYGRTELQLFRAGYDTLEIARHRRIPEAKALELVTSQRSAMLGLSSSYKSHSSGQVPWPSGRISYAGTHK